MTIKVTFKTPITFSYLGYFAVMNFLHCHKIELNDYGMIIIDGIETVASDNIDKIEIVK
jgi:hypothetical protein